MKKQYLFWLLAAVMLMSIAVPASGQSKKQKKEAVKAQIMKRVEARYFKISVTDVGSNREINQTGIDGSVEVKDSLLICNLPYYGKLHGIQHDPSKIGLNFQSTAYDYLASILYDGTAKVLFNARRDNEEMIFYIEIKPDGRATVSVHSDKRSPATYTGDIELK